jgi:hypothetical protein
MATRVSPRRSALPATNIAGGGARGEVTSATTGCAEALGANAAIHALAMTVTVASAPAIDVLLMASLQDRGVGVQTDDSKKRPERGDAASTARIR